MVHAGSWNVELLATSRSQAETAGATAVSSPSYDLLSDLRKVHTLAKTRCSCSPESENKRTFVRPIFVLYS